MINKKKKLREMKRVDLSFLDNPQFKIESTQKIKASKEEVFQFLKGADNWLKWHTSITKVIWTSPEPYSKRNNKNRCHQRPIYSRRRFFVMGRK